MQGLVVAFMALAVCFLIYRIFFFKGELSDEEIKDIMSKGFVDGAVEESKDIIKEEEDKVIKDILDEETTIGPNTGTGTKTETDTETGTVTASEAKTPAKEIHKRQRFYEGDINWKFTDVNENNDCWANWDYVKKGNPDIELQTEIKRSLKRKDGREWCAVSKPTPEAYRREKDPPRTIMDEIDDMTGNKWGLVGAIGLGLTEELIRAGIKKSTDMALKRAAKKAAEELSESLLSKAGKELNEEISQKISKKVGNVADDAGKKMFESSKNLRKKFSQELNEAVVEKFNAKATAKIRNKLTSELKQDLLGKYGKKSMQAVKDNLVKKITSVISSKNINISTGAVKNLLQQRVSNLTTNLAKATSSNLRKQILSKATAEIQQFASAKLYKSMITRLSANVTDYMATKLAKVVLSKALVKTKVITVAKTFFKLQSKLFLSIGKTLANSSDNIAKLAVTLAKLSKTLGKQTIKNAYKIGLKSAAKIASKLKPGPLAVLDIASAALDAADPMQYNAFLNTKDYNKAVEDANADRKKFFIDELLKSDTFKDSGLKAEDIEYPIRLDPTSNLPTDEDEASISNRVDMLFKMAKVGTPHVTIAKFINSMNEDLASGKLKESDLENDAILTPYTDLIDTETISVMTRTDNCKKVGGVVYDTDKCTYPKDKCDSLYTWPLSDARPDDVYAEYKGDICVQGNPEIRTMCESMKAKWDINANKCILDRDYCKKNGGEMDSNGECNIPLNQEILEYIFGTTITRVGKKVVDNTVSVMKGLFDMLLEGCGYDGEFKIRGKCMDGGNDLANGNRIKIWNCDGSKAQQWYYSTIDSTIRPQEDYSKCIDIKDGKVEKLGKPQIWSCNGTNAQKFTYDEETGHIMPSLNQTLCLDLENDNNSDGTVFNLIECKDHQAQKFSLKRNAIVDTGATCSVTTSRAADCPDGYTNNGLTCGRGADVAFWDDGRYADCPSGYRNMGVTCQRDLQTKTSDFGLGSYESADCPRTYTNTGTSCYRVGLSSFERDYFSKAFKSIDYDYERCENKYGRGNCEIRGLDGTRHAWPYCTVEAKYLNKDNWDLYTSDGLGTIGARCGLWAHHLGSIQDKGVCPPSNDSSGKYKNRTGGLCYVNCEEQYGPGWYNNGTDCALDADTTQASSMTCNSDEFRTAGKCYKKCADVYGSDYEHNGTSCYRKASTLLLDSMVCKPGERIVLGRCYPKVFNTDFTDLGLTQSRAKLVKRKGLFDVASQVKTFRKALAETY